MRHRFHNIELVMASDGTGTSTVAHYGVDIPDDATPEQIKEIEQMCINAVEDVKNGDGRDIDLSF